MNDFSHNSQHHPGWNILDVLSQKKWTLSLWKGPEGALFLSCLSVKFRVILIAVPTPHTVSTTCRRSHMLHSQDAPGHRRVGGHGGQLFPAHTSWLLTGVYLGGGVIGERLARDLTWRGGLGCLVRPFPYGIYPGIIMYTYMCQTPVPPWLEMMKGWKSRKG